MQLLGLRPNNLAHALFEMARYARWRSSSLLKFTIIFGICSAPCIIDFLTRAYYVSVRALGTNEIYGNKSNRSSGANKTVRQ